MKKTKSVVIAAFAAASIGFASQQAVAVDESNFRFDSTADLYAICSVTADAAEFPVTIHACRAFIEASVQYHDQISKRKKLKRLICYPATATIEESRDAFVAWAKANIGDQKLMAEQPVVGLVRALAAKYPCKG